MYNVYVFVFCHLYLQCARSRSRDMNFKLIDKFLVLCIKFHKHGFSMNCDYTKLLVTYVIESILSYNLLENPLDVWGFLFVEFRVKFWLKCLFSSLTHRPITDSVTPLLRRYMLTMKFPFDFHNYTRLNGHCKLHWSTKRKKKKHVRIGC